jgi:hypothetical protein
VCACSRGQEGDADRRKVANDAPDIILTNFMTVVQRGQSGAFGATTPPPSGS